jgi:predicted transcriptional regulator
VTLLLLKTSKISQLELSEILNKSHPTISRTIQLLVKANIINSYYLAPGVKYSLKNKPQIISWMTSTHPKIIDKMSDGIVEMFSQ